MSYQSTGALPKYMTATVMKMAPVTTAPTPSAAQIAEMLDDGSAWDAVFCTDMMNLAEFRGLAPVAVRGTPTIAYFHENQLTYPSRTHDDRDLHFAFTNMISAVAADAVREAAGTVRPAHGRRNVGTDGKSGRHPSGGLAGV